MRQILSGNAQAERYQNRHPDREVDVNMRSQMKKRDGLWIAGAVLLLDRLTKVWAAGLPAEGFLLIPGVVRLRLTLNDGAAFSLLGGNPRLLGLVSLAVIAAAVFFLRRKRFSAPVTVGLMMMLGGALGNLMDRLGAGPVPDWIELLFVRFAVFNAADACLTVGCALVMGCLLFGKEGPDGRKTD